MRQIQRKEIGTDRHIEKRHREIGIEKTDEADGEKEVKGGTPGSSLHSDGSGLRRD